MSPIFCDTSAFYAVVVPEDHAHQAAASAWQSLLLEGHQLVTTNYIILESLTLLQSRFGLETAKRFHEAIQQNVQVHAISSSLHEAAIDDVFRFGKRKLSLVDCSSFIFMRHSHISKMFAYDPNFEEQGFQAFTPTRSA